MTALERLFAVRYPLDFDPSGQLSSFNFAYQSQLARGLITPDAAGPLPILPVQLFESFGNFAICLLLLWTWRRQRFSGQVFALYMIDPPPAFDYAAYLDFLDRHHHNFFRLWTEEEVTWEIQQKPNPAVQNFMGPLPWARTGPGAAVDGKPKFDLSRFHPAYFERLRSRIQEAGRRGIYVSVMLFEGWVQQDRSGGLAGPAFPAAGAYRGLLPDAGAGGAGHRQARAR